VSGDHISMLPWETLPPDAVLCPPNALHQAAIGLTVEMLAVEHDGLKFCVLEEITHPDGRVVPLLVARMNDDENREWWFICIHHPDVPDAHVIFRTYWNDATDSFGPDPVYGETS
jgi:hypothetical protein